MSDDNLVYGIHAVAAVIARVPERIAVLQVQEGKVDQRGQHLLDAAEAAGVRIEWVPKAEMNQLPGRHQGVVAHLTPGFEYREADLEAIVERNPNVLLLVLDGVTDPHNLGACLRSAEAAGVDAVIAPRDKAASLTPVVRKVASGAAEVVPFIQVTNLARTLRDLQQQGVWIVGAAGEAENTVYEQDLSGPIALVMGAEGSGMRRLTREHCDYLVKLPMAGTVSSLNVSVAAGVCLFEAVRQRLPVASTPSVRSRHKQQ
ncbi:MAG TPA: 23S rRNA (guanosine(2251)-2'-O)-methyltransferase RlmB [Spongiibacteraceae bacterium]|nr:23S rRNA (guanosine(2251)-2'-O)-methyltransferase RlmB [Spongiibacteraceae bacterium]